MVFLKVCELSLRYKLEHVEAVGQLAHALYRRMRQFQFWQAFNAIRWPTNLVSCGQVEAMDVYYIVTCLLHINRK